MTKKVVLDNGSGWGEERSVRAVTRLGAKENLCEEEETEARGLFLNKHIVLTLCQAILEVYKVIQSS